MGVYPATAMISLFALRLGIAALAVSSAGGARAQEIVPARTPNADALAAQMRLLASNPRDVSALIAAGELSAKLGDPAAAMAFFGRAQAIDPGNPRLAAGRGSALVALQRPGEALRLFDQAERGGVAMTPFLSQRGLAYDLIGQQGHAQRDYRRALQLESDDETVRRLALSLGISGKRDEAMALLDPLLRKVDRAGWRARAFVLAMTGDVSGAQMIAASMMSGGAALTPFFVRLQTLSPADRAFAVHFGEISPTVARANDARLAPALAALPADVAPTPASVAVAAVDRPGRSPSRDMRRARRPGREPIQIVTRQPGALPPAAAVNTSPAPTALASTLATPRPPVAILAPQPVGTPQVATAPPPNSAPVPAPVQQVASAPPPPPAIASSPAAGPVTSSPPAWAGAAGAVRSSPLQPAPSAPPPVALASVTLTRAVESRPSPATLSAAPPSGADPAVGPSPQATSPGAAPRPAPVEVVTIAPPPPPSPVRVERESPAPAPPARAPDVAHRDTAVLASIIETIDVPPEELAPAPRSAATRGAVAARPAEAKPVERAGAGTKAPDTKAADAKKPDVKTAEAQKPEPKKPEPKKPDPARAEPARWWVQVAGGANEADLGKDWTRLAARSPAAFRGRSAWTTPLRATNRLLAGPFKAQDEAMAFVNTLKKDGSSAFAWQSEAGQKIARLPAR